MTKRFGRVAVQRDAEGPFITINCQGDLERIYISEGNLDVVYAQVANIRRREIRNSTTVVPLCRAEERRA